MTDHDSRAEERLRTALGAYAGRFEPATPPEWARIEARHVGALRRSPSRRGLAWISAPAVAVAASVLVLTLVVGGNGGVRPPAPPDTQFIETIGASAPQYAAVPEPVSAPGTTMAAIQARGFIRVGIKYDQPAFGVRDTATGDVRGFDAEIAKLLAIGIFGGSVGDLGTRVQFQEAVSKDREALLQNGSADIVIATYSITPTRSEKVDFAGPYFRARQDIMVRTGETSITSVDDLTGRRVCTVRGSTSLQNLLNRNPKAEVVLRDTYSECATELSLGEVDAVSTDQPILAGYAHQSGGTLKVLNNPFSDELYGIGIAKGDEALRTFLNTRLEEIVANGDWARAHRSYLADIDSLPPSIGITDN